MESTIGISVLQTIKQNFELWEFTLNKCISSESDDRILL